MKNFELLLLKIFLIVVSNGMGDDSWLSYDRTRTKRWINGPEETPRICLDSTIETEPCNFDPNKPKQPVSKWSRSAVGIPVRLEYPDQKLTEFEDKPEIGSSRGVTVVYRIKGCLPSRLPFDLPICEERDLIGRVVRVQILVPFKLFGNSKKHAINADVRPPWVFPNFEYDGALRTREGPWPRRPKYDDDLNLKRYHDGSQSEWKFQKFPKRRKSGDDFEAFKRKSNSKKFTPTKITNLMAGTNEMLKRLNRKDDRETKIGNDFADFYRFGTIENEQMRNERSDDHQTNENLFYNDHYEFPYEKAIPYDPKKLKIKLGRKIPISME